jgi:hypothetical protein
LRLIHLLTELGSSLVHVHQWEYNLQKEGKVGTTSYGLVGPNPQATAQKHNGHPICLSINALTRWNTEGAD